MIELPKILEYYQCYCERSIKGRRITLEDIQPLIEKLPKDIFKKQIIGHSELGKPIYKISVGFGDKKILIWTQMHGNESTGTKALFDLFNIFKSVNICKQILEKTKIHFVTMLNPDGSQMFTRVNYKNIDLNRDAVDLKALESKVLRKTLEDFNPHFCFNLHDQRTVFNVKNTQNPATISFLAPSVEVTRRVTETRKQAMSVIVAMNEVLSKIIPNHIGRYTDEFYPKATGDNFQKLGHNTILIEAGHYPNDYKREQVRKFNCIALFSGIDFIANTDKFLNYKPYFSIPNNDKKFYDIIVTNVNTINDLVDIAYQYEYKVISNQLVAYLEKVNQGDLSDFFAHYKLDMKGKALPKDFISMLPKIKV